MQLHHERTEERRKLVKGKQDTESSATNIHEKWKKILGTVYILGDQGLSFSLLLVHWIPCWLVWTEIECMVLKWPINRVSTIWEILEILKSESISLRTGY